MCQRCNLQTETVSSELTEFAELNLRLKCQSIPHQIRELGLLSLLNDKAELQGQNLWCLKTGTPKHIPHEFTLQNRSTNLGASINGVTPVAGWFITENPIYKWMI